MTPRPPPSDLLSWALAALAPAVDTPQPAISIVAGDASNRRYFRAVLGGTPYILVEAPPATEKNQAFLAVRELLAGAGLRVPALYAADLERGYLLLEDLGDRLLLAELGPASVDSGYRGAMQVLLQMAALEATSLALPAYDKDLLQEELSRFPTWFVENLLGQTLAADEQALLQAAFATLLGSALEQPRVVVHRDFHSRNLMPQADGGLGVIDFQDAVVGPVTYDLVSLLRDCYIQWPAARVQQWALDYLELMQQRSQLADVSADQFLRWFDLMGLQRHIKVLGTFARLYLRDGKSAYLDDLPLVIEYVLEIAGKYAPADPALGAFHQWFSERLMPLVASQPWSTRA